MQASPEESGTITTSQQQQQQPSCTITEARKQLPIWKHRKILIDTIKQNDHCIIVSSTGSGKTTQLPQFMYESGLVTDGWMVAITQPRRVAAISVAQRVADELGQGAVGTGPVGYCVRFEDCSDPRVTRLRYMTDGMLLREAVLDPTLSRYSYVILDEAHERSLNTDVLFGIVLRAAQKRAKSRAIWLRNKSVDSSSPGSSGLPAGRPNEAAKAPTYLKVIVMSATIDPTPFVNFLGPDRTRVIYIEGRPYPIRVLTMSDPATDYVTDAAIACIQIHLSRSCSLDRGILIFLTGEEEIMRCCSLINQFARLSRPPSANGRVSSPSTSSATSNSGQQLDIKVFPLFASLPQGKQLAALSFSQPHCRKVIVSTNLAETSITIPGIRYVIDCGYAKVRYWDTQCGLESFRVQRISKSQAWQRAGRAGREAAGICLRLYTDAEYKKMPLHPQPELVRAPMAGVLLNLIAMNVKHPQRFPWLTAPKEASLEASLALLHRLGAVETDTTTTTAPVNSPPRNGYAEGPSTSQSPSSSVSSAVQLTRPLHLTPLGSLMSAFPLEPRFSRVVISSAQLGCLVEVLSILSMLYVSPVFYVPLDKRDKFSETQQQFHHPDGDLASLLLVYRAYVKKSRKSDNAETNTSDGSTNQGASLRRVAWCRAHCLNRARLDTAIRVRMQLKQVCRGSGLARAGFRSCGPDMYKITQAFLQSGFHDQVALLADSALLSAKVPSTLDALNRSRRSVYTLAGGSSQTTGDRLFLIHPESQLYLPSLSDTPPAAVLFIETAVTQSNPVSEQPPPHVFVYMRHVATVRWGFTAQSSSGNQTELANWLSSLLVNKSNYDSTRKRRRHDRKQCSADGHHAKRALMVENPISLETPEAATTTAENVQSNCMNGGDCGQSMILSKRQRRRLAKRRRKSKALENGL